MATAPNIDVIMITGETVNVVRKDMEKATIFKLSINQEMYSAIAAPHPWILMRDTKVSKQWKTVLNKVILNTVSDCLRK